jgi:3-hydroxyisobutyrate dehydrogenase-like beta-hydroxyacid dehydrogenase
MERTHALIGFGEAGSTFAAAAGWGRAVAVWDLVSARRDASATAGLSAASVAPEAVTGAPLVLSLVTADQSLRAARDYAPLLTPGAVWCDMNSVSPETKRASAEAVAAAGGRYVDVAVLAPVDPARLAVPLLLAGEAADEAGAMLRSIGFTNLRVVGAEVGRASAINMIKGIEALTDEMMAAAGRAGVVDEVVASLDASEKARPWSERAAYNLERMATHGLRRAAEMEEAASTLRALGVEPLMTTGTVLRQRAAAGKELQQ